MEWIYRFCSAPAVGGGWTVVDRRRPSWVCCMQAPDGARVASPQCPILRWSKGWMAGLLMFPVSLSLRAYRRETGKWVDLVAIGAVVNIPFFDELFEEFTHGCGAHRAVFSQPM